MVHASRSRFLLAGPSACRHLQQGSDPSPASTAVWCSHLFVFQNPWLLLSHDNLQAREGCRLQLVQHGAADTDALIRYSGLGHEALVLCCATSAHPSVECTQCEALRPPIMESSSSSSWQQQRHSSPHTGSFLRLDQSCISQRSWTKVGSGMHCSKGSY